MDVDFLTAILYVGIPASIVIGVGGVMAVPKRRHPIVRAIGIAIILLVLWYLFILWDNLPA